MRPLNTESADTIFSEIGKRTLIMGVLNVTPDSFSDGGMYNDVDSAVAHALQMKEDGADIIDIGGESSRPGAESISVNEELGRTIPVIQKVRERSDVPISIDTYKSQVAESALVAGATIVNDISAATFDTSMPTLIAQSKCYAVIMHMAGTPTTMQNDPHYDDVTKEVFDYLTLRVSDLMHAGVDKSKLVIDPGIGFGKTVEHNLELLRRLREFRNLDVPVLVGTSRKSTIGTVLGGLPPEERLEGTAATVAVSIVNGADIVRVHDVKEMTRVARMTDAIVRGSK